MTPWIKINHCLENWIWMCSCIRLVSYIICKFWDIVAHVLLLAILSRFSIFTIISCRPKILRITYYPTNYNDPNLISFQDSWTRVPLLLSESTTSLSNSNAINFVSVSYSGPAASRTWRHRSTSILAVSLLGFMNTQLFLHRNNTKQPLVIVIVAVTITTPI